MVSVQVNQLKCNLNQNRKNSQRSSSEYCNLIKSKDDIDQLLFGPGHDIHKILQNCYQILDSHKKDGRSHMCSADTNNLLIVKKSFLCFVCRLDKTLM